MERLRLVGLLLALARPVCASREPPEPTDQWAPLPHASGEGPAARAASALAETSSAHALNASRELKEGDESSPDPPKPDTLKSHLASDGPMEQSINSAAKEAEDLLNAVKEWSKTSKGIAELSKKVVDAATKDDEELHKVHQEVQKAAEAGVGEALNEQKGSDKEASLLEVFTGPATSSQVKAASSRHAVISPSHRTLAKPVSLVQPAREELKSSSHKDDGDVKALMSSLHADYDELESLLVSATGAAAEAKETAKIWASKPSEDFQETSKKAKDVADAVAQDLRTNHASVEQEVTDSVRQLLSKHGGQHA